MLTVNDFGVTMGTVWSNGMSDGVVGIEMGHLFMLFLSKILMSDRGIILEIIMKRTIFSVVFVCFFSSVYADVCIVENGSCVDENEPACIPAEMISEEIEDDGWL